MDLKNQFSDAFLYHFFRLAASLAEKIFYLIPRKSLLHFAIKFFPRFTAYHFADFKTNDLAIREYLTRLFSHLNRRYLATFLRSYVVYSCLIGGFLRKRAARLHKLAIPRIIDISPTSACNLKCKSCYASEHAKQSLAYGLIKNRIIKAGNILGINTFDIVGGEPLLYPRLRDLVRDKNPFFIIYTNGYLIDEKNAGFFMQAGNVMLLFSLAGYRENTDRIRGRGTYNLVRQKMLLLKKRHTPFGLSLLVTKQNWEEVSSLSFIDDTLNWGAFFIVFFVYGPLGRDAQPDYVMNAEEKQAFNMRMDRVIQTKPMAILNEMNSPCKAAASNGGLFHINSNGDIEPCVAIQLSTHNIRQSSLLEILASDFFRNIRQLVTENKKTGCIIHDDTAKVIHCGYRSQARFNQPSAEKQYAVFSSAHKAARQAVVRHS